MRAAVLQNVGDEKVEVRDDVELDATGPGQVRVAIRATGVCHSDLSVMNGTIPQPAPCVLGHEGAGEIVEVGAGVSDLAAGDHVIVCWIPPCGQCIFCLTGQANLCTAIMFSTGSMPHFKVAGQPVFGMAGTGTFAEELVLPVESAIKIDPDVPWDIASLIGCGVTTGVGAAINRARVRPGSSVMVFGCGGVGISVIQGARVAGAAEIVAVDLVDSKRKDALRFGATDAVHPDQAGAAMAEITKGIGFDYTFEAIGLPTTIRAAYDMARRGGTACIVGVGRPDQTIEFNAFELFFNEKTMVGTLYGSADVRVDFHRLIRLWRAGRLDLEGMVSKRAKLDGINEAFDDMKAGRVIRTVLEVSSGAGPDGRGRSVAGRDPVAGV
jgi:S-(hydroxymethyl)glutathione dehydrogenase/alcohol dehydrogenase